MSLLFVDGFEHYGLGGTGANNMSQGLYSLVDGAEPSSSFARTGSNSLRMNFNSFSDLEKFFVTSSNLVGFSFGVYFPSLPGSSTRVQFVLRNNSAYILTLVVTPSGELQVHNGSTSGSVIAVSSSGVITPAAFNHVELKLLRDSVVGAVEVRVNGETVINITGIDFGALNPNIFALDSQGPSSYYGYIDDLILWDGSGSANNDFIGPARVNTVFPASDTAQADFAVTGAASGFQAIDDLIQDGDTTYISSDVTNDISEFGIGSLPSEIESVVGVYVPVMSKIIAAGTGNLQVSMVSSGQVSAGVSEPLTTAYTYRGSIFETNPNGDIPWNKTDLEAALIRVEKTG